MEDKEKELERLYDMIYICNFNKEYEDKYYKALWESRAYGKISRTAYDRTGKLSVNERGLYFKTRVEYHKFLNILNCINNNEPYEYHDLKCVDTQELLDEINLRMNIARYEE